VIKLFNSPTDLMSLEIIDFQRLNGYWSHSGAAMTTIFSHLERGRASYAIYDVPDFDQAPDTPDWLCWDHVGDHAMIGRKLWNWFHEKLPEYTLTFRDAPDFQAHAYKDGHTHFIWGDIGMVSASSFAWAQKFMRPDDIWMSILNGGHRHVSSRIMLIVVLDNTDAPNQMPAANPLARSDL
jgi:hypothetical protein